MTKKYGNLIINIFWRILALCLVTVLSYVCFNSYLQEHYTVVPGSIEYKVTKNGKHFKNFTVDNSYGKVYRLEGKVDKNGRIIYFANGEKLQIQSKMSKYIKTDSTPYCRYCEAGNCEGHFKNKYNFIKDNHVFCYHENGFHTMVKLLISVLCVISFIGLILGIIRNIEFYRGCKDYDWKVIRRYDCGDYFTPFGLYIDAIVCDYDLKKYIKEFFGYDNK
jgi:hypothetical protein